MKSETERTRGGGSHGTKASLDKIGKVIIKGVGAEDEAERREELTEWRFAFY